jgi:hypothetical protein
MRHGNRPRSSGVHFKAGKPRSWFWELGHDLAGWAQIIGLGVLIFGYFYTVRPVYERDRLEEDVSRAELELRRLRAAQELAAVSEAAARSRVEELEGQRKALEASLAELKVATAQREERIKLLSVESEVLHENLTKTQTNLDASLAETRDYERVEYLEQLEWAFSRAILNDGVRFANREGETEINFLKPGLAQRLANAWYEPLKDVAQVLRAESNAPPADKPHLQLTYAEVLKGLQVLESVGSVCTEPDYHAWENAARKVISGVAALNEQCADKQMREWARANDWDERKQARYAKAAWWQEERAKQARSCGAVMEIGARFRFETAWLDVRSTCHSQALGAFGALVDPLPTKRKAIDLDPLQPPLANEILEELAAQYTRARPVTATE